MWIVNRIVMAVFDGVYAVLGAVHPAFALVVISGVFGVIALVIIRYCSNQTAVGRIKDRIKANLLAIKLYKDELRVMFRALPRILWATAKLQAHMIPPLLVMIVPMILICAQMAGRHEWRPLRVGERAVLTIGLSPDAPDSALDITPRLPADVSMDHRVRATEPREVSWYVQASQSGRYTLAFPVGDEEVRGPMQTGHALDSDPGGTRAKHLGPAPAQEVREVGYLRLARRALDYGLALGQNRGHHHVCRAQHR